MPVPALLAGIATAVMVLAAPLNAAQVTAPRPTNPQLHVDMKRLDWMIGKWEGTGWVETAETGARELSYSLNVRSAFDGLLLIIDGASYESSDDRILYAEQLLISGPPFAQLPGPPGTYGWREFSPLAPMRANEAQGSERTLQVGYGFSRQECTHFVANAALRETCRSGEMKWSRVQISLNDEDEWIQTREWQERSGDEGSWHMYFKVVLQRMEKR